MRRDAKQKVLLLLLGGGALGLSKSPKGYFIEPTRFTTSQ